MADYFGTGESSSVSGGNGSFTPPVHACDSSGNPVTVSFGLGSRSGQTLIASGHAPDMASFYGTDGNKLHDHFGPNGESGRNGDRGCYRD